MSDIVKPDNPTADGNPKSKKKPLWKQRKFRLGTPLLILLITYACLWVRYYSHQPILSRNFSAELNAPILEVPEENRAWTHYRRALMVLEPEPKMLLDENSVEYDIFEAKPGDPRWRITAAYLNRNQKAIAMIRKAATKETLGCLLSDQIDPADIPWQIRHRSLTQEEANNLPPASDNPMLLSLLLPGPVQLFRLSELLVADMRLAVSEKDVNRLHLDLLAVFNMAKQLPQNLVITHLIKREIIQNGIQEFFIVSKDHPDFFSDQQLQEISAAIASCFRTDTNIKSILAGERLSFYDVVQRVYTDDGNGNGVFRPYKGWFDLSASLAREVEIPISDFIDDALAPINYFTVANRKDMVSKYDSIMDILEESQSMNLWNYNNKLDEVLDNSNLANKYRPLIYIFLPSLRSFYFHTNRAIQERDAALVVIALHRYRLKHDSWPEKLEQLVPTFLPKVPPDRFTGKPLLYRLAEGKPLVYSVGEDRDDDGGKLPEGYEDGYVNAYPSLSLSKRPADARDGDWILWPHPKKPHIPRAPEPEEEFEDEDVGM